jgi:hypothetical protein
MSERRLLLAVAVGLLVALLGASLATAARQKPRNGGFEAGNLSRWQVDDLGSGPEDTWYAYSGTSSPASDFDLPAPPQGTFAAITDQGGSGAHILHRTRKLRKGYTHKLKLWVFYENRADEFASPDTLDPGTSPNQQYRIDVLKRHAAIDSVDSSDILKRVLRTEPGDPLSQPPKKVTVNLTRFAGKRVQLRFAEVDTEFFFNAGVDGVELKSKPAR